MNIGTLNRWISRIGFLVLLSSGVFSQFSMADCLFLKTDPILSDSKVTSEQKSNYCMDHVGVS